jgi:hypothetical protein
MVLRLFVKGGKHARERLGACLDGFDQSACKSQAQAIAVLR